MNHWDRIDALLIGLAVVGVTSGCVSRSTVEVPAKTPPLVSAVPSQSLRAGEESKNMEPPDPQGPIDLSWAFEQALRFNPSIRGFSAEADAREAMRKEAGLWPNPEIEGEVENVGGSGRLSGFDGAEVKSLLGQEIVLAGKIRKREHARALEEELAQWNYEEERLDVLTETATAFYQALAAQERVSLAKELVKFAEQGSSTVKQQVEAGDVSPVELNRVRIPLERRRIELERAKNELASARQQLAAHWGAQDPRFPSVKGDLEPIRAVPEVRRLVPLLRQNPSVARWSTQVSHAQARLALEKARRIPNIKVKGGVKNDKPADQTTWIAGVSVPLPIIDRNQYGVEAAKSRLNKAKAFRENKVTQARVELESAYQELRSSYEEVIRLEQTSLPSAKNAYQAVREGYESGKFGILDLLDAQRTLFEVREAYLEARPNHRIAAVRVERLIGQPLPSGGEPLSSTLPEAKPEEAQTN